MRRSRTDGEHSGCGWNRIVKKKKKRSTLLSPVETQICLDENNDTLVCRAHHVTAMYAIIDAFVKI